MELDLKDILTTLIIGAYAFLGAEAILHYIVRRSITGFFSGGRWGLRRHVKSESDPVVVICLCFSVGLITADLTHKFMDKQSIVGSAPLSALLRFVHDELKYELLPFGRRDIQHAPVLQGLPSVELVSEWRDDGNLGCGTVKVRPTPLAIDLVAGKAFSKLDAAYAPVERRLAVTPPGAVLVLSRYDAAALRAAIDRLFYFAKNTVYLHSTYADEMRHIEDRVDFTRSIGVVSFWYIAATLVATLAVIARRQFKRKRSKRRWTLIRFHTRIGLRIMLVFTVVYVVAVVAYTRETLEYSKRAFGYYSTLAITAERRVSVQPAGSAGEPRAEHAGRGLE
jgi:hypothetical protein